MKVQIKSFAILVFLAGTLITSCGDASKDDIKEVKDDIKEVGHDMNQANKDAKQEVKDKVIADWDKFKTKTQVTIDSTQNEIKLLREKIAKANKNEREKLTADLDKLEQKNNEMKEKIAQRNREIKDGVIEFNDAAKENEQKFEREFSHDMKELGTALKDLFKNNID